MCLLYRTLNVRPVSPMYLRGDLWHFNLQNPLWLYATFFPGFRWFLVLLVVFDDIFIFVFLNRFVINLLSVTKKVTVVHFNFCVFCEI